LGLFLYGYQPLKSLLWEHYFARHDGVRIHREFLEDVMMEIREEGLYVYSRVFIFWKPEMAFWGFDLPQILDETTNTIIYNLPEIRKIVIRKMEAKRRRETVRYTVSEG
jgi:hypothetical protein